MRIIMLGLVVLGACGGSGRGGSDASADDASGDGSSGGGALCGGLAGRRCTDTEYCDFVDNTCGVADEQGTCKPRPGACPLVVGPPTCGCNGQVYTGMCEAYHDGTDLAASGGCDVAAGRFACGYLQCTLASQYCLRQPQAHGPETFTCAPLPNCSTTPSCSCLAGERCGNGCTGDSKVGLTLTCVPTP
jgi:hypothetical protein